VRTMLRATCSGQLHRVGGATLGGSVSYPVKLHNEIRKQRGRKSSILWGARTSFLSDWQ
jgi:hypothetical protein